MVCQIGPLRDLDTSRAELPSFAVAAGVRGVELMDANKAVARLYFEALDRREITRLVPLFFTPGCRVHLAEVAEPLLGHDAIREHLQRQLDMYSSIRTTLDDVVAEADRLAVRLTQHVVHRADWASRVGMVAAVGRSMTIRANALLWLEQGRIAEAWLARDELGMLLQLRRLRV